MQQVGSARCLAGGRLVSRAAVCRSSSPGSAQLAGPGDSCNGAGGGAAAWVGPVLTGSNMILFILCLGVGCGGGGAGYSADGRRGGAGVEAGLRGPGGRGGQRPGQAGGLTVV